MKEKKFKIIDKFFNNCYVIKINQFKDDRGSFKRIFCLDEINKLLKNNFRIKQAAKSFSLKKGTFRGLHMQIGKYAEDKYIFCEAGKLCDIIIDMRKKSKTYLSVKKVELKENDNKIIFVAKGCAHGFITLKNATTLIYFYSNFYNKKFERTIKYNDVRIKLKLPEKIQKISKKDNPN